VRLRDKQYVYMCYYVISSTHTWTITW